MPYVPHWSHGGQSPIELNSAHTQPKAPAALWVMIWFEVAAVLLKHSANFKYCYWDDHNVLCPPEISSKPRGSRDLGFFPPSQPMCRHASSFTCMTEIAA